jgi:phage shock protein PspC (stress-responsive transcriptional regulator)
MNKVITINLGGNAYQLEEGGYDALRAYLENAAARLKGNPDRDEIVSDIERAIAEKFRALLGSQKTVVETKEVAAVVAEMGPIEADPDKAADPAPNSASGPSATKEERAAGSSRTPRRLYRIHEGAMLAGVCNGIGGYLNIDPTFIRLAFVFLTLLWGTGLLVYVVIAIVVPEACSPEEKAAASGLPSTAQEFIRRAKAGYYEAFKGFPDRKARREWKRRFNQQMCGSADQWRQNWHNYWAEQAATHPGIGFALPLLSLLQGAATIMWMCATISLLATGAVFGIALPPAVPVWAGALILFVAYGIMAAPLKLARRACYWGVGRPRWAGSSIFLADAVVWAAIAAAVLWLATHYYPELREAVRTLPAQVHQATNDIQLWWKSK